MVISMELESTIVTINNLLKLNFNSNFEEFIQPKKEIIAIPDYQREYKWEKSKVKTFVNNIMQRSKFLGIITVESSNQNILYLVDGQQRLTTIILMLSQLYNKCADEKETETQDEIENLIAYKVNGSLNLRLKNESIGEYINFLEDQNGNRKINLDINKSEDIYKQSNKFNEAWNIIGKEIDEIRDRNPDVTLDVYKQRLLDCEMLLFAQKNTVNMQQGSSEEIYIDINEKAQKLDSEDIFKGHCFAICKIFSQQHQVKTSWRFIKQNFFFMDKIFKKADMGAFLHFYLLTQEATKISRQDIKKDLTIDGENIITRHYNTPTKVVSLLKNIEKYQLNILDFVDKLNRIDYKFSDIMTSSPQLLGNNSSQIKEISTILKNVINCNQNLFKLPLFYLIDENYKKETKLTYHQLSNFSYLYYIYMFLFSRVESSKKREDLANNLIYKIHTNQNFLIQFIKEIKHYGNGLEITMDEKTLKNDNIRKQLYTILDYFKCSSKKTPTVSDTDLSVKLQLFPESYNLEHLIVNKSHSILWRSVDYDENHSESNLEYTFISSDFNDCSAWDSANSCWANFIWIDETFNRNILKNKDIINKIILLRGSCEASETPCNGTYAKRHSHIEIICQHIMNTNGYNELLNAYKNNESRANVLNHYKNFINNYFSENSLKNLNNCLTNELIHKLQNLYQMISM